MTNVLLESQFFNLFSDATFSKILMQSFLMQLFHAIQGKYVQGEGANENLLFEGRGGGGGQIEGHAS